MIRTCTVVILFLSFCYAEAQQPISSPSQNKPEKMITLICNFDKGTVESSITESEEKNLKTLIATRFGLPSELAAQVQRKVIFQAAANPKSSIIIDAHKYSFSDYQKKFCNNKNYSVQ